MIRDVAATILVKADRAVRLDAARSAAAGAGANGIENHARGRRGRTLARKIPGEDDDARVQLDEDPAMDNVKEQLSIFTVMKIVSPHHC